LKTPQKCRPKNDSRQNLAYDFWLAELDENVSQQLSKPYEQQQKKEHSRQVEV
jgi:hypothetical protein